jgi:hypothetical protein
MLDYRSRSCGMPSEFLASLPEVHLSRTQNNHLVNVMKALIVTQGPKTTKALARAIPGGRNRSSLSRHFSGSWQEQQLLDSGVAMWLNMWRECRGTIYHIIDDTANPHSAKACPWYAQPNPRAMEAIDQHHDHHMNRMIWAHSVVTSHVVCGSWSVPWKHQMYRRKQDCQACGVDFYSKVDIACSMVEHFEAPARIDRVCHLADAWYTNTRLIETVRARGPQHFLIGGIKLNAVLPRQFGRRKSSIALSQILGTLRGKDLDLVTIRGKSYQCWRCQTSLFDQSDMVVLLYRQKGTTLWRAVACTDASLSAKEILTHYAWRWEIEVGHWYLKCALGFADYRLRSLHCIHHFWCAVILTYWYLEWFRHRRKLHNLAEAQQHFAEKFEKAKILYYWSKLKSCKTRQAAIERVNQWSWA